MLQVMADRRELRAQEHLVSVLDLVERLWCETHHDENLIEAVILSWLGVVRYTVFNCAQIDAGFRSALNSGQGVLLLASDLAPSGVSWPDGQSKGDQSFWDQDKLNNPRPHIKWLKDYSRARRLKNDVMLRASYEQYKWADWHDAFERFLHQTQSSLQVPSNLQALDWNQRNSLFWNGARLCQQLYVETGVEQDRRVLLKPVLKKQIDQVLKQTAVCFNELAQAKLAFEPLGFIEQSGDDFKVRCWKDFLSPVAESMSKLTALRV